MSSMRTRPNNEKNQNCHATALIQGTYHCQAGIQPLAGATRIDSHSPVHWIRVCLEHL